MESSRLALRTKALWQEKLPYLAPGVFLFILPFPGTVALRLTALSVATITAAVVWKRTAPPPIPLKLPIALWLLVAAASLIWAVDPGYSLLEIKNEIGYTTMAYLSFYVLSRGERQWRNWNWIFMTGFVAIAAISAYYLARGMDDVLVGKGALLGRHGGPGSASTYLILVSPLLLLALERSIAKTRTSPAPWILLVIMISAAYMSGNRIFWIALTLSVTVYTGLRLFRRMNWVRAFKLTALVFLLTFIAAGALLFAAAGFRFSTGASLDAFLEILAQDPRMELWRFAIAQIGAHPLFGTGFGLGSARSMLAQRFDDPLLWHAHNIFLNYGLQMGIPGMLTLVLLFASIGREFIILYRSPDDTCSALGTAGLTMLAGILAKSMTDNLLGRNNSLLFWALTGMILGYGRRILARDASQPRE